MTYIYDGMANRVEKSNGTLYWFGMGSEALEETDLSGNLKNDYVFFGGKRIARHTASANYYYVEDHLGSSRVITDASGNKCYDADFYPFGGELTFTNTCAQNYKFTGKERNAETGNDNFGARYYSSSFGRFLSPDWSAIPEPVPYANLTNPQTLNLYQYVEDDPETFADLDGDADSGENGQNNNKSAQTSTTTCGQAALDATGACTTTKVDNQNPAPTAAAQQQNDQKQAKPQPGPAPKNPDGTPKAPNIEPPKDVNGKPTEWNNIDGSGPKGGDRWIPRPQAPSPDGKGGRPQVVWDPEDGYWTHDNGGGERTHWDPETGRQIMKAGAVGVAAVGTAAVIWHIAEIGALALAF